MIYLGISRLRRRRALITVLCAVILAAGTLIWLLRPHTQAQPEIIANNVSGRPTICLAADSATATKTNIVPSIWATMQRTGTASGSNVQQLIEPAADPTQTQALLAGLVSHHCNLVVTVGPAFAQAIGQVGKSNPKVKFAAIDSALTAAPANTSLLDAADASSELDADIKTVTGPVSAQASPSR